jgi:hypothetical protein
MQAILPPASIPASGFKKLAFGPQARIVEQSRQDPDTVRLYANTEALVHWQSGSPKKAMINSRAGFFENTPFVCEKILKPFRDDREDDLRFFISHNGNRVSM